ncbi:organomercurial lyase [Streptomyces parvus]|uniref:organomercurial lyase n=1 Tax=Streptomyces parvus TaxID=66428 RepID=UPI002100AF16|nr:organomercurial lyase [Streptomyces parvus]MCQ1579260.1 organomercurial lyase [Streptomyces parvus]
MNALRITVLTVPDCPNAPLALERITAALDGREADVDLVEVRDEAEAAGWGMTGSPTVLIDGVDPFAVPGAPASVSCRLYRNEQGRAAGAPSVEALRKVLAGATECCDDDLLDPIGRAGRGRRAPVERGLRAVHQAVLRHFATTGSAPGAADLETVAAEVGRTAADVLSELDAEDFLALDADGRVRAAYPFSAVETPHRVRLGNGVEAWSMCAIDALGIAAMLDQDTWVTSSDPVSGHQVTVSFTSGTERWEPEGAVVFVGRRPGQGPAADVCCDALNFFADRSTAEMWASRHPDIPGRITGQAEAVALATQTFGPLLAED